MAGARPCGGAWLDCVGTDSKLLEVLRGLGYHTAIVGTTSTLVRAARQTTAREVRLGVAWTSSTICWRTSSYYPPHHKSWSRDGTRMREQGYDRPPAAEAERMCARTRPSGSVARVSAVGATGAAHPLQPTASEATQAALPVGVAQRTAHADAGARRCARAAAAERAQLAGADAHIRGDGGEDGRGLWARRRRLRETGMLRDSLVAFLSDNGR